MNLAVMQPYIFPYIGYFQLLHAADTFVFFNDVQYKRRSYISRNAILVNDKAWSFSVPTQKADRQSLIKDIQLHTSEFENWRDKFLKTIEHSYNKAPYFNEVMALVTSVLDTSHPGIGKLAEESIRAVASYLNIGVQFKESAQLEYAPDGDGQDKIIAICKLLGAHRYINAINGRKLYKQETFKQEDIELAFIDSDVRPYQQSSSTFVSHLSILDMMMYLNPEELRDHLQNYNLLT